MFQRFFFLQIVLLSFQFLAPLPVLALPTINVSFAGNSSYVVSGTELENVGKIELAVSYNSQLLANPGVTPRSSFAGSAVAMDTDYAGNLNLTVTSKKPMQGRGTFAAITFDPIGTTAGCINSVTGRMYSITGALVPAVMYTVTNPTAPLDPSDPDDIPMIKEREANGQSFMGGDVAYLPPEAKGGVELPAKPAEERAEATGDHDDTGASGGKRSADGEGGGDNPSAVEQSVLERFRLFKGERSAKKLMALFDRPSTASFRQEPPIVVADGKETVRAFILRVRGEKAPNFTFNSAHYVSFSKVSESEWLVEARPDAGASDAEIIILCDGKVRRIPLTVTPAVRVDLTTPGKVSEADFELFLKERGTENAPSFDLNGDGKRNYLDDYIFTANYLLATKKGRLRPGHTPLPAKTAEKLRRPPFQ